MVLDTEDLRPTVAVSDAIYFLPPRVVKTYASGSRTTDLPERCHPTIKVLRTKAFDVKGSFIRIDMYILASR